MEYMRIYLGENHCRRNSEERRIGITTEMQRQALGRTLILMFTLVEVDGW